MSVGMHLPASTSVPELARNGEVAAGRLSIESPIAGFSALLEARLPRRMTRTTGTSLSFTPIAVSREKCFLLCPSLAQDSRSKYGFIVTRTNRGNCLL